SDEFCPHTLATPQTVETAEELRTKAELVVGRVFPIPPSSEIASIIFGRRPLSPALWPLGGVGSWLSAAVRWPGGVTRRSCLACDTISLISPTVQLSVGLSSGTRIFRSSLTAMVQGTSGSGGVVGRE